MTADPSEIFVRAREKLSSNALSSGSAACALIFEGTMRVTFGRFGFGAGGALHRPRL